MLQTWLILTVGFLIAAAVVPGFKMQSLGSALVAAAIFGILNYFFGQFFYRFFVITTLGLAWVFSIVTRIVVNAILLKITDLMTDRLTIVGFTPALFGGVVIGVAGTIGDMLTHHVVGHHWL